MAISIESTNDAEKVREDFARIGIKVNIGEGNTSTEAAEVEESSGKPDDTTVTTEVTGDKTEPESDTGKPKTQEPPSQGDEVTGKNAKKKIGQLTERLGVAREELEAERGDKSKLRSRIEELESEIATLKPQATEESKLVRPKRPARPDLAEFEYDATKYGSAMKKYDVDLAAYDDQMDEYRDKVSEQKTAAALKQDREQREQERRQAEGEAQMEAYYTKLRSEISAEYPDSEDFWDGRPDMQLTDVMRLALVEDCDHPATVTRYLAENPDEVKKAAAMTHVRQATWIARLDTKLWDEHQASKKSNKTEDKPVNIPEKKAPATQVTRTQKPDAPIEPLGGRPSAGAPRSNDERYAALVNSGNTKDFVKEFNANAVARAKARRGLA